MSELDLKPVYSNVLNRPSLSRTRQAGTTVMAPMPGPLFDPGPIEQVDAYVCDGPCAIE